MTEDAVRSALAEVLHRIAPEVDLKNVAREADLRETLDIDSFDFLNLLVGLHEKLGVDIPESDYGKLRSLDSLIKYVVAAPGPAGSH